MFSPLAVLSLLSLSRPAETAIDSHRWTYHLDLGDGCLVSFLPSSCLHIFFISRRETSKTSGGEPRRMRLPAYCGCRTTTTLTRTRKPTERIVVGDSVALHGAERLPKGSNKVQMELWEDAIHQKNRRGERHQGFEKVKIVRLTSFLSTPHETIQRLLPEDILASERKRKRKRIDRQLIPVRPPFQTCSSLSLSSFVFCGIPFTEYSHGVVGRENDEQRQRHTEKKREAKG